jgi:16S rRNA (uracil1498-N3)-methyltransferase
MLSRFYLNQISPVGDIISINDHDVIHQLTDVLRLKKNDVFIVFSNQIEYEVILKEITKETAKTTILETRTPSREPHKKVILYQSLLKSDKFEWILQKGVELGVSAFVPIISDNCVVREISKNKLERYHKIIAESLEQCGGLRPAELLPVVPLPEALRQIKNATGQKLLAWENNLSNPLAQTLDKSTDAYHIFIGPEGGFSESEVKSAEKNSVIIVSLGNRILRAETAAVAACALALLGTTR